MAINYLPNMTALSLNEVERWGKMTPLVLIDSLDLSKASNENFYTTTEIIAE